jgi:iron(III) transport system substrate-binding protein
MVVLSSEDCVSRASRPGEKFGQKEGMGRRRLWAIVLLVLLTPLSGFSRPGGEYVVAYCAQDEDFAMPIFRQFEKESGIAVKAVYDNEAVKTVGLANRLLAEKSHPVCDVFWGNEELRTRQMAAQGAFRATNGWSAFGHRSRRIVINTNLVSLASAPQSLSDLTRDAWRAKVALAYPQFGTTSAHFHALRQVWGDARWLEWCKALASNKPALVDGNSVVVKLVGKGEAAVGLTDSDDIAAGQQEGLPIVALKMSDEMLLIPNTAGIVRGAPHAAAAERLYEYLQSSEVNRKLVLARALEADNGETGRGLAVNWEQLLQSMESTTRELNRIFLR